MTKLDKEIQQELYDPDPETQGKMKGILHYAIDKLFDPKSKQSETHNKYYVLGEDKQGHRMAYDGQGNTKSEVKRNFEKKYPNLKIVYIRPTISLENLNDPRKGTLKITGDKPKLTRLKKHLEKEHPSTKGHMKVLDPKTVKKRYIAYYKKETGKLPSQREIDDYLVFVKGALYDPKRKAKSYSVGDKIFKTYDEAEKYYLNLYFSVPPLEAKHTPYILPIYDPKKSNPLCSQLHKLDNAHSRQVRFRDRDATQEMKAASDYANTIVSMSKKVCSKEKVYDPKKPAEIYVITDSKGNKHKASYAEWLKWMKEQAKRMYDPAPFKTAKEATEADKEFMRRKTEHLRLKSDAELRHTQYRGYDPYKTVPRWYEAMVRGIKKRSDVRNPYKTVKNIWARLKPSKRAEIQSREAKGEVFKYDLPLPKDVDTKGTGTLRMVKPFKLAEAQVNVSAKDMKEVKKSGIFKPMRRQDGSEAQVSRCKSSKGNTNIFVDEV